MKSFETIEHTADIGIRAFGSTEAEAFENAAYGMFCLIADLEKVGTRLEFPVEVEAEEHETLLVEWLNELLYTYESNGVILKRFRIDELGLTRLKGVACGAPISESPVEIKTDIKAATYYQLRVEQSEDRWVTEVIFDV